MAETAVSPNNARILFKGNSMAKKSTGAIASPSTSEDDTDWQARSAFNTIKDAEQHQQDPDMMKRVATHAKKESAGLSAVMSKLQKRGLVSDKQAEKIAKKRAGDEKES